jgi:hypothetical protein
MQPTTGKTFTDKELAGAICDTCNTPLAGAPDIWTIDSDEERGLFCSKTCAALEVKDLKDNPPAQTQTRRSPPEPHRPSKPDKDDT